MVSAATSSSSSVSSSLLLRRCDDSNWWKSASERREAISRVWVGIPKKYLTTNLRPFFWQARVTYNKAKSKRYVWLSTVTKLTRQKVLKVDWRIPALKEREGGSQTRKGRRKSETIFSKPISSRRFPSRCRRQRRDSNPAPWNEEASFYHHATASP